MSLNIGFINDEESNLIAEFVKPLYMWIMRGTNRIEIIAFQQDKVIQKALLSQHFPMRWIMLMIIGTRT